MLSRDLILYNYMDSGISTTPIRLVRDIEMTRWDLHRHLADKGLPDAIGFAMRKGVGVDSGKKGAAPGPIASTRRGMMPHGASYDEAKGAAWH